MMLEMNAVIQRVRALSDLVKANQTLRNFNELVAAVYEVNAKLLAAQSVAELKKEVVELKNWDRERERYQLTELAVGTFARSLKPGMEHGEPAHHLCATCFEDNKKSILQATSPGVFTYRCPRCQSDFPVRNRPTSARIEGV